MSTWRAEGSGSKVARGRSDWAVQGHEGHVTSQEVLGQGELECDDGSALRALTSATLA